MSASLTARPGGYEGRKDCMMVSIYKDGEYFASAENRSAALTLLNLFEEVGTDIAEFEIRDQQTAPRLGRFP